MFDHVKWNWITSRARVINMTLLSWDSGVNSLLGWPIETWTLSEVDILEFPWQTLEKHCQRELSAKMGIFYNLPCPVWQLLAPCDYAALEMWPVQPENWIFHFNYLNVTSHVWTVAIVLKAQVCLEVWRLRGMARTLRFLSKSTLAASRRFWNVECCHYHSLFKFYILHFLRFTFLFLLST